MSSLCIGRDYKHSEDVLKPLKQEQMLYVLTAPIIMFGVTKVNYSKTFKSRKRKNFVIERVKVSKCV